MSKQKLAVSVRLDGVEELQAKLRKLDRAMADETLKRIANDGSEMVRTGASQRAPVGTDPVQRKRLRDGIFVKDLEDWRPYIEWAKVAPLREVAHANLQEFGTVHHPPSAFMRPAFDAEKQNIIAMARRVLLAEIRGAI